MGYIVTIYSKSAYKEYLLPAVRNANHTITLKKELFQLSEDANVEMENIDGEWRINSCADSTLVYTESKKDAFGKDMADGDIYSLLLHGKEQISIIVRMTDSFFHAFDKFSIKGSGQITIGKGEDVDIQYDYMHVVSQIHAIIMIKGDQYIIEDRSMNGLFVNARRVVGSCKLEYGDLINVFGLSIVFMGDILAIDVTEEGAKVTLPSAEPPCITPENNMDGAPVLFHRSPRYLPKLADDTIKIEPPPSPKDDMQEPAILTIGPAITMALPMVLGCVISVLAVGGGIAFMITGLVTAIGSAIVGTVWALANMRHAKKKFREDELKRFEVYGEYLISCANQVQEKYERNTQILRQLYVAPDVCCGYDETSAELWNRNRNHADFLQHRLGIGAVPFQVTVEVPDEHFSMLNDSLAEKAKMIRENYSMLWDVPVCADLNWKIIGVIGGAGKAGCYPVVYALSAQLAANNCYTDLKLAYVYNGSGSTSDRKWSFTAWLPHVWSEDKRVRYVADNKQDASDVLYELSKVLRMRAETDQYREDAVFKPHYVLFTEDLSFLEGELITTYLLDKRDLGVTVVLLVESYEELPNACEHIIENTSSFQGVYEVTDPVEERCSLRFDTVAGAQIEAFARKLSGIQVSEVETGGELPATLTFFEMYGIRRLSELNVEERWRKNRTYDSIRGLLGQKSGGANCYLDVHEKYHGPHGLVAGTTGSGKSETLQTYMLSLAVNYSPDDIGFFIIDYKGGGMANLFSGLPHLIGQISNLSGNQVHRAMVSIKSENVRRQRVFNEHGVNNINNYTRLYKTGEARIPVPHMFIVIDEFAELKREEPDFMKELISVAQVGRSLGVHLILATQKPSGTVDDNIWSNSKFRLCLRVQDQQDSKDMLHRPDAAYITQAGRCYLQVGNDELFDLFQSGWSGAAYEDDEENVQRDIASMLSVTGKAALVGSHAQLKRKETKKIQWIALLIRLLDELAPEGLQNYTEDAGLFNALTDRFFARQPENFPQSDYNAMRLKDLVEIYAPLQNTPGSAEEHAASVISLAAERGAKLPEPIERTQLEAVKDYLAQIARQNGYIHNLQLWLPVLPTELYLNQLDGYAKTAFDGENWPKPGTRWALEAMIGMYDDPVNQAQGSMCIDFANNGSHVICGMVSSGKSTFLVSALYSLVHRYTPDMLNIYALDFSSRMLSSFEGLAHVGGVMYESDTEKIDKFFYMLSEMLAKRKAMLRGGNYTQMIQAECAAGGDLSHPSFPAVIVVVDNYAAFRSKTDFIYDDFMVELSKDGVGCGIYLMITAMGFSTAEIPLRMGENLRTVLCLEMPDRFAYGDAMRETHLDLLPETNVKGRGLCKLGDRLLEFQTALSLEAPDDFARMQRIRAACDVLNAHWSGAAARPIPEIPEKPVWKDFAALPAVAEMQRQGDRIPVGYDKRTAAVYGINLNGRYCYLISGKSRTGKTNMLRIILASSLSMETDLVLVDLAGEFPDLAQNEKLRYVSTDQEMLQFMLDFKEEFVKRNQFKWDLVHQGATDEEITGQMEKSFRRMLVCIGSLSDFVQHAEHPEEGIESMTAFVSNLLDKGANHNVFWFACFNQDESSELSGQRVFELFTRYRSGIHFGGNVEAQRILDFEYLKYNERGKILKPGIGMLPQDDDNEAVQQVVIPLYRR